MEFKELMEIIGAIALSLGGGAALVFALSKWLGNIWAGRILENEKANLAREHELLIRRRDVYSNLVVAMRVFIDTGTRGNENQQNEFLKCYDLAALWASESVMNQMAAFIDSVINKNPSTKHFLDCISEMRKDCGFPSTKYQHRIVNFDD